MNILNDIVKDLKSKGEKLVARKIVVPKASRSSEISEQVATKGSETDDDQEDNMEDKDISSPSHHVIDSVFQLRENFVVIGLTGRTGSGCTTIAEKLATKEWKELKSNYKDLNSQPIDNDVRKNRIVHRFLKDHWKQPFDVISASDIIFYYALKDFLKGKTKPQS